MQTQLNPCTCGEEPQVLVSDPYVQVWCPNCMATTALHGDHEEMVKDWNQQNPHAHFVMKEGQ